MESDKKGILGLGLIDVEKIRKNVRDSTSEALTGAVGETAKHVVDKAVKDRLEAWRPGKSLL